MDKAIQQGNVRIIKIDKEALFEFIYESFVADQENMMDVDSTECMNNFAIDWEEGTFIFTAHKAEDDEGNIVSFPRDIDLISVMRNISATTDSALSPGIKYKDYSFNELRGLQ